MLDRPVAADELAHEDLIFIVEPGHQRQFEVALYRDAAVREPYFAHGEGAPSRELRQFVPLMCHRTASLLTITGSIYPEINKINSKLEKINMCVVTTLTVRLRVVDMHTVSGRYNQSEIARMRPRRIDMQGVATCLWFDKGGLEAAELYVSLFKNAEILSTSYYVEGMPGGEPGDVLEVRFVLDGTEFLILNGGPRFPLTAAVSIVANCETQAEIDELWDALTEGGEEVQCGWLTDRFGVSWQIVPVALGALLSSPDRAAAMRATEAMLRMKKLDIAALESAFAGL
jgi:predicted 3-demethylubiquinone-9 3-methyltransferase (glyoxalase superfamily)